MKRVAVFMNVPERMTDGDVTVMLDAELPRLFSVPDLDVSVYSTLADITADLADGTEAVGDTAA